MEDQKQLELEFFRALYNNEIAEVKKLIKKVDVNKIKDPIKKADWTPLISAIKHTDNLELIKELLAAGAEVNIEVDDYDSTTTSPLIEAVFRGNLSIVKELIRAGANVDYQLRDSFNALNVAVEQNLPSIVTELIKAKANLDLVSGGNTALMNAAFDGRIDIAKQLIAAGADLNKKDDQGRNATYLAYMHDNEDILELLLNAGADIDLKLLKGSTLFTDLFNEKLKPEIHKRMQMEDDWASVLTYIIKEKHKYSKQEFHDNISKFILNQSKQIPNNIKIILNTII